MRKNYYLVLDVETANGTDDALVYDLGFAVVDSQGFVYHTESLIVSDIFFNETELMQSAYYAEKIPKYLNGIKAKAFRVVTFSTARKIIAEMLERWNVKAVCAYNAHFDTTALNTTERWLTKSKYRYFLPYGTQVFCIWNMACQVICTKTRYIKFCLANGFVSPSGNIKTSAETVYAYLTKDSTYEECHTGLEDVLIEAKIMARCFAEHKHFEKNINRLCWRIPQAKAKELAKRG